LIVDKSRVHEYFAYEVIVSITASEKETADAIIETVVYLYTESRRLTKTLAKRFGLTGPQLTVIKILDQIGDLSLSSLSGRIKANNSTVTGIIDRMEREGLVRRERSQTDRRMVLIRLTDKGRALAGQIEVQPMEIFRQAVAALPESEMQTLFSILDRVQRTVRQTIAQTSDAQPAED
jgi:MarR family transcriptional regulator, organic hydroperoxide resistance regulator